MAEVQPLSALRYDPSLGGSPADVTAPPYDVISPQQRAALLARSPHNIVAIDLPLLGEDGRLEDANGEGAGQASNERDDGQQASSERGGAQQDPYARAGARFAAWQRDGILKRDSSPAFWVHTQEYTGPDGIARTRRGFFCKVRIEEYGEGRVRPHERTHPGPKEDRLKLMRATKADLSPIFSLYSDPGHEAWDYLAPGGDEQPHSEVTDADGTVHRIWRADRPEQISGVQAVLEDAELLIADGHHRYETAKTYAEEVGGEGEHRYILMCLVALEDPGLTVFPTHRLLSSLDDERRKRLTHAIERDFQVEEVALDALAPQAGEGPLQLGLLDWRKQPLRLTLKDQAIADQALQDHSAAYRHLDTGVLEALLLKGALGLSEHDIAELNGLWYARDTADAISLVQSGEFDAAFLMRPTPVSHVREVAASGENMPPKSTYFFPKLLTGLLINPLA